ncbi:unnamed protein product, partial [Onchocerca ochengi]|uniref:SH2 domain-containing protein n=1 Tax=Onchocerca ochengi TaxID=42157 RepID=A0A182EWT7_ONCOC
MEFMSDSEKNHPVENDSSLNLEQSDAAEDAKIPKTIKSISDGTKDGTKKSEKSTTVIAGAESGDCVQQNFNKNQNTSFKTNMVPSKFQLFFRSRTYLTREANEEYLARLLKEKDELMMVPNNFQFKHAVRLIDD